jgi:hypothetical protein
VTVGQSFQQFRCLRAPKFVRAIAKDLGEILLCNYRKGLVLFRHSLRRCFLATGFRDVLGFSTVGLARANRPSAPIKFWRHRIFVACATRARLYHERDGGCGDKTAPSGQPGTKNKAGGSNAAREQGILHDAA